MNSLRKFETHFCIHEGDYSVVNEILSTTIVYSRTWNDQKCLYYLQQMVEIQDKDTERRVSKLRKSSLKIQSLPHSIGRLGHLVYLNLSESEIGSLPPSIGKLVNLKELWLSETDYLLELPDEIGDLGNLIRLELDYSAIEFLPPSIQKLQNLRKLSLGFTKNLSELPETIGTLASLKKLDLCGTDMNSLPHSIGKLESLQELWLSEAQFHEGASLPSEIGNLHNLIRLELKYAEIEYLPDAIGCLSSLERLNLDYTWVVSLPSSIGQLQSLKELGLSGTDSLLKLPEEIGNLIRLEKLVLETVHTDGLQLTSLPETIGNLTNLKFLDLRHRHFSSLPDSFVNLMNLMHLDLDYVDIPELRVEDPENFLLKLAQSFPFLGSLGEELERQRPKVIYALACNRARFRTELGTGRREETFVQGRPELWPLLLENALAAFDTYPSPHDEDDHCVENDFDYQREASIPKTEAIYRLLVDGREFFLRLLINTPLSNE